MPFGCCSWPRALGCSAPLTDCNDRRGTRLTKQAAENKSMQRILLKTTIPFTDDDCHIGRFSLLQQHLRSLRDLNGNPLYEVHAHDRVENGGHGDGDPQAAGGASTIRSG